MLLVDVNVLVYAFRSDAVRHQEYKTWLETSVQAHETYAVSDFVLSGFLRIVTHPRIFVPPTPISRALDFVEKYRSAPNALAVSPGRRHWEIFLSLCRTAKARGNLVPDVWLAALAIESGCELITTDRDLSRFTGLRHRHPLDA